MAELDDVIKRDVKGLYKKALNNEISNFVGLDPNVPYQVPINPDITINTQSSEVEESFKELKMTLKNLKII